MLRFQDLMGRFLDTQRSVMLSYLQGGSSPRRMCRAVPASRSQSRRNGHATNGHIRPHSLRRQLPFRRQRCQLPRRSADPLPPSR